MMNLKQIQLVAGSAGWGWNTKGQLGVGDVVSRGDEAGEMVRNPSSPTPMKWCARKCLACWLTYSGASALRTTV